MNYQTIWMMQFFDETLFVELETKAVDEEGKTVEVELVLFE